MNVTVEGREVLADGEIPKPPGMCESEVHDNLKVGARCVGGHQAPSACEEQQKAEAKAERRGKRKRPSKKVRKARARAARRGKVENRARVYLGERTAPKYVRQGEELRRCRLCHGENLLGSEGRDGFGFLCALCDIKDIVRRREQRSHSERKPAFGWRKHLMLSGGVWRVLGTRSN